MLKAFACINPNLYRENDCYSEFMTARILDQDQLVEDGFYSLKNQACRAILKHKLSVKGIAGPLQEYLKFIDDSKMLAKNQEETRVKGKVFATLIDVDKFIVTDELPDRQYEFANYVDTDRGQEVLELREGVLSRMTSYVQGTHITK